MGADEPAETSGEQVRQLVETSVPGSPDPADDHQDPPRTTKAIAASECLSFFIRVSSSRRSSRRRPGPPASWRSSIGTTIPSGTSSSHGWRRPGPSPDRRSSRACVAARALHQDPEAVVAASIRPRPLVPVSRAAGSGSIVIPCAAMAVEDRTGTPSGPRRSPCPAPCRPPGPMATGTPAMVTFCMYRVGRPGGLGHVAGVTGLGPGLHGADVEDAADRDVLGHRRRDGVEHAVLDEGLRLRAVPADAQRVADRHAARLGDARRRVGSGSRRCRRLRRGRWKHARRYRPARRGRPAPGPWRTGSPHSSFGFTGIVGAALPAVVDRDADAAGVVGQRHAEGGGVALGPGLRVDLGVGGPDELVGRQGEDGVRPAAACRRSATRRSRRRRPARPPVRRRAPAGERSPASDESGQG